MNSNFPSSSELQEWPSEEDEAEVTNEKVRNALSLNAWHVVLQASCKFITGILADVSSGRRLLQIKNPYQHLFFRSCQDLKNLEPLQRSFYIKVANEDIERWVPSNAFSDYTSVEGPVLTEDMKLNMLEQQLTLLIHASRCLKRQKEESASITYALSWPVCYNNTPYCHIMRKIFEHLLECRKKPGTCNFGFCEPAKRIVSHFKNCPDTICSLCSRVSYLLPAKPRVRRNAIDDVDLDTYLARLNQYGTPAQPIQPSEPSERSSSPASSNIEYNLPYQSGVEHFPEAHHVLEPVPDIEPTLTMNDSDMT